ncbi:hypothetical protein K7X08_000532 [Anisodus acutangulus]|uniref:Uncharacterized protein n=1 Tax=Anisodus acutangulus TaxID=402998 RepID=A0A9Q1M3P3_9SOLA|nr:hypothetical protein K7X08_000532 [Anisodus acutangulus]
MTKSITILQSFTGMNNACRSHYMSNSFFSYTSFSLKEQNLKCFGGQRHSLSLLSSRKGLLNGDIIKRKFVVSINNGSLPSSPSSNPLNGWVIGILLSIALPFFRFKWGSLLQLKNTVKDVIETVEDVVDEVEKVAGKVDKLAEHMGNVLPEGQLKNALKAVEKISEDTAEVAHAAGDIIDKLQGDDVELLVEDLPKDQLKDFSEKTAKVAHAAEDLKDKVQAVELKAEERAESFVESVNDEVNKSTIVDVLDINSKK